MRRWCRPTGRRRDGHEQPEDGPEAEHAGHGPERGPGDVEGGEDDAGQDHGRAHVGLDHDQGADHGEGQQDGPHAVAPIGHPGRPAVEAG